VTKPPASAGLTLRPGRYRKSLHVWAFRSSTPKPRMSQEQALLVAPAYYPRHAKRGEPRTHCGVPAARIGLAAGGDRDVKAAGGGSNGLAASGAPGSGGRPPRPPGANELAGRPPRAAQASRNWPLASRKVPGKTAKLLLMSVFGAAMIMLPATLPDAVITLSGVRIS
jgi:hypothetical protein